MKLPDTDITILSVRNCLGYPSTDLGTLCSCNKVNMWSKHKPVIYNADSTDGDSNWYKARSGNCGINIPSFNSPLEAGKASWTQELPTGGAASPYRLGDFRGYDHNAVPFMTLQAPEEISIDIGRASNQVFYVINQQVDKTSNLSWDDFTTLNYPLKNCYLACYIEKVGATYTNTIVTAENPISSVTNDVVISFSKGIGSSSFTAGTYHVYFLLSSAKIAQNGQQQGPTYYPVYRNPNNSYPVKLSLKNTSYRPLTIEVPQVAASGGLPASNFVDLSAVSYNAPGYLNVRGYNLFFKCTFKNILASGEYTFYKENMVIEMFDPSYNLRKVTSEKTSADDPYFYVMNESGQVVNMAKIPQKGSVALYVVLVNPAVNMDGNFPPLGSRWKSMMEFRVSKVGDSGTVDTAFDTILNLAFE